MNQILASVILISTCSFSVQADDLPFQNLAQELNAQGASALQQITREQQTDWKADGHQHMQAGLRDANIEVQFAGDIDCTEQTRAKDSQANS